MGDKIKAFLANAKQKLASLRDFLAQDAKDIYNQNKLYFFIFGAIILVIKFRDILISILVNSGKREVESAKKEDQQLSAEAKKANDDANKLVDDSKKLGENKPPVDEDWNKK